MDHKCFFELGISLKFDQASPPTEVEIRNAIGRIYYYTYHEALELVNANEALLEIYNELKEEFPSFHKRLFRTFVVFATQNQDLSYGTISRHLGNLHTFRCSADYNLEAQITERDYFSFLANLDSLKLEIVKKDKNFFDVQTSLNSQSVIQTNLDCGKAIVRKRLRVLD